MIGFIICAVVALPVIYHTVAYIKHLMTLKNYPSGTFPLPIIGNLHQITKFAHIDLANMAKCYGDVFSISFGMKRIVIVNAYEPAKEALITKAGIFADRDGDMYVANLLSNGRKDIIFADYKNSASLRKIGNMALQMHGDGQKMNERMIREADELANRLRHAKETPVSVKEHFGITTINVLNTLLFGKRYMVTDEDFHTAMRLAACISEALNEGDPASFLPWLRYFPMKCVKSVNEANQLKVKLFRKKIQEHEDSFDETNLRDFTDFLLNVFYKEQEWRKYGLETMDYELVQNILSDMLIAGFDTSATASTWALLYLLHWPKYQEEIYQQMLDNITPNRRPTPKDRKSLPLLEAFIQESLRFTSHVPMTLPRKTIKHTTISGMPIPKGTTVFFNTWQIHHDERYWNQPNEFNPYRWLDSEGKYSPTQHPQFLLFSAGKRSCFGEPLARLHIFSILSTTLYEFEILPNPEEPFPSFTPTAGGMLYPQPYSVIFKKRE